MPGRCELEQHRDRAPAGGDLPPLRLRLPRVRAGVAEAAAVAADDGERVETVSALQERDPARPARDGAAAARPVDQRDRDVPRPDASTSRSARRSCRCCAPTRSRASGSPAARPARRSTRSRSCSSEEGLYDRVADLRDRHQRGRARARAAGVFPLDKMQEYTQNYIRAGGTALVLGVLRRALRRRAVRAVARRRTLSSPSTTSSPTPRSTSST